MTKTAKLFYKAKKEQLKKEKIINKIMKYCTDYRNFNRALLYSKNIDVLKLILKRVKKGNYEIYISK